MAVSVALFRTSREHPSLLDAIRPFAPRAAIVGPLLDRYRCYKLLLAGALTATTPFFIAFAYVSQQRAGARGALLGLAACVGLLGFPVLPTALDLSAETTYPISAGVTTAILWCCSQARASPLMCTRHRVASVLLPLACRTVQQGRRRPSRQRGCMLRRDRVLLWFDRGCRARARGGAACTTAQRTIHSTARAFVRCDAYCELTLKRVCKHVTGLLLGFRVITTHVRYTALYVCTLTCACAGDGPPSGHPHRRPPRGPCARQRRRPRRRHTRRHGGVTGGGHVAARRLRRGGDVHVVALVRQARICPMRRPMRRMTR